MHMQMQMKGDERRVTSKNLMARSTCNCKASGGRSSPVSGLTGLRRPHVAVAPGRCVIACSRDRRRRVPRINQMSVRVRGGVSVPCVWPGSTVRCREDKRCSRAPSRSGFGHGLRMQCRNQMHVRNQEPALNCNVEKTFNTVFSLWNSWTGPGWPSYVPVAWHMSGSTIDSCVCVACGLAWQTCIVGIMFSTERRQWTQTRMRMFV